MTTQKSLRAFTSGRFFVLALLPLAIYSLIACAVTWPLITQFSTHVAGGGFGDSFEYVRLGWWGQFALQHGLNPFYQSLLGYPGGFLSATQIAQPLIYWPIALLSFLVGPVAGFNLWIVAEIVLSGLTAYWLCYAILGRDSTGRFPAALIGGLVFMIFPAVQGHLVTGHVNPLSNYALPLVMLCLWRILNGDSSLRTILGGAGAIMILMLGNFTAAVFSLLPIVLFGGLYFLVADRSRLLNRRTLIAALTMFVLGMIAILPFYLPLFAEALSPDRPGYLQEGGAVRYSADLLGFIAPSPFTPWGEQLAPSYSREVLGTNSTEGTAYLGILAGALAIAALIWRNKPLRPGFWLAIALGSMLFSLGPLLKINDQPVQFTTDGYTSGISLPWALFQNLPLVNVTRTPGRFNLTTGLALCVLTALGLTAFGARRWRFTLPRPARFALTGLIAALISLDYLLFFPFLTTPAQIPSVFYDIAAMQDVRAVYHIPYYDPIAQKEALLYQIAHHKPLIAGYVSRRTPVDTAKLALLTGAATRTASQIRKDGPLMPITAENILALFRHNGVDVIVYHWELLNRDQVEPQIALLYDAPLFQNNRISVYRVPAGSDQLDAIPITFGEVGWWRDLDNHRWLTEDGSLYIYAPEAIDRDWQAEFASISSASVRLSVGNDLRRETLRADKLPAGRSRLIIPLRLDAGFHTLQFSSPDPCRLTSIAPKCLLPETLFAPVNMAECQLPESVPSVCVGPALRTIAPATPPSGAFQEKRIQLAGVLEMTGYRAPASAHPGETIRIVTEWQAGSRLNGNFHTFIHILNAEGTLAAQADQEPGNGAFATDLWAASQHWIEVYEIALPGDLLPGVYSLYAGWYRFPEITRLPVLTEGSRSADNLIFLTDIQIEK